MLLYYLANTLALKNLVIATKWMNLENIILSEVRLRKANAIRYHLYVESKE